MRPVFASLGFNVEGGEFVYAKKDKVNPSQQIDIVQKLSSMGLPIDDDDLYDTFCVKKPDNYEQLKAEKQAEKEAVRKALASLPSQDSRPSRNASQKSFKQRLNGFFGIAPEHPGA